MTSPDRARPHRHDRGTATDAATPTASRPAEPAPPVVTVVLVRHGRSTANTAGILAGRTPGVNLDDYGRGQAAAVADRLAGTRFDRLISSPLERCRQTAGPVRRGLRPAGRDRRPVRRGRLRRLVGSAAQGPGHRTALADRAAACLRGRLPGRRGAGRRLRAGGRGDPGHPRLSARQADQTVLICSHGDVIKAILADALGMHLDAFQRIVVAPASISVIRYTPLRPFVERDQRHRRPRFDQSVPAPPTTDRGDRRSGRGDRQAVVGRRAGGHVR